MSTCDVCKHISSHTEYVQHYIKNHSDYCPICQMSRGCKDDDECFFSHMMAEKTYYETEMKRIFDIKENAPVYMLYKMKGLIPEANYNYLDAWTQESMSSDELNVHKEYIKLEKKLSTAQAFIDEFRSRR